MGDRIKSDDQAAAMSDAALLEAMLDNFPGGICLYDAELRMVRHNQALCDLLDLPASLFEPAPPTMEEMFRFNAERGEYGPGDVETKVAERLTRAKARVAHVYDRERPDGRILEIRGAPLPDGGFVTTYLDVTEQRRRAEQFEAMLETYPGGLCMYDRAGRLTLWNEAFKELLELPEVLFADGPPTMERLFRFNAQRGEYGIGDPDYQVAERLDRAARCEAHQYERRRPNGRILSIRGEPIGGGGFLTTYHDVTEHHQSQELITHMAHHDALTDLPNRLLFADRLEQACEQAKRGAGFALHYIDLDRFKPVNDGHGHAAGDQVLKVVAERLQAMLRGMDTVARLGGDEFAVIQTNVTELDTVQIVGERIIETLSRPIEVNGDHLTIGASIGVALAPQHSVDPDTLIGMADDALYAAKMAGRGVVKAHQPASDDHRAA